MISCKKYNLLIFILVSFTSYGQISPGELSEAHATLEGISNCTKCHELGDRVTDQKCLDCHVEIQTLVNRTRGYHANPQVVKQDCFECHSEHYGRKFDMIHLDEEAFEHELTGYELEGKHEAVDCRKCHVSENIQDRELRQRKKTFLGLDETCLSCHEDYHQKTLASTCLDCHTMDGFTSAENFDHDTADFKLAGEHVGVDCIECHKMTTKNGREFQEFTDIPSEDCISCHEDPHNNQLHGQCVQCHTETSFSSLTGLERFDHNITDFTLRGRHNTINCFSCHTTTSDPLRVFQDRSNVNENSCVSCHKDVHQGKFGNDCVKCHRERSFLSLRSMDFFDHSVTDYPLEGQHINVDCKLCHKKRFTTAIDFSACKNCHSDYHEAEFSENNSTPDCVECHSLEKGFDYSLYTLEEHQTTSFPLAGAHIATPCFACHTSESDDRWTFRNLGATCAECHQDIHEGFISEKYYPEDDCRACHLNDAWTSVNFDHGLTGWPLDGEHIKVACRECHFTGNKSNTSLKQSFNTLEGQCTTCHENIHGDEFAVNGVTDCKECHVTDTWFPKRFNHDLTAFPLEGEHTKIGCSACHEVVANGQTEVVYKLGKFKCIDCHL